MDLKRLWPTGLTRVTDRSFSQSGDDVSQGRQRLVYVLGFIQHSSFCSSLTDLSFTKRYWLNTEKRVIRIIIHVTMINILPDSCLFLHLFTASQIHQVEFATQLLLRFHMLLLDVNQEDAVAAGTVLVHVCTKWKATRQKGKVKQRLTLLFYLKGTKSFLCIYGCSVCTLLNISTQPKLDTNAAQGHYFFIEINNTNPIVSCSPHSQWAQLSLQMVSEDVGSVSAECWSIRPLSALQHWVIRGPQKKQYRPHNLQPTASLSLLPLTKSFFIEYEFILHQLENRCVKIWCNE